MESIMTTVDIDKPPLHYLTHTGIKGMHWGHHKAVSKVSSAINKHNTKEKDFRSKLSTLEKKGEKGQINDSDYKRVQYRNHSAVYRASTHIAGSMANEVLRDAFKTKGNLSFYKYMTKDQWKAKITKVALKSARELVTKEVLARSAANKYDQNGKLKKGQKDNKDKWFTKEDKIEMGLKLYPIVKFAANYKAGKAYTNHKQNKATFDKWGANILTAKASSIGKVVDFVPHNGYTVR